MTGNEQPSVDDIMREIRSGLADTALSEPTLAALDDSRSLPSELRRATESSRVMGRCGGSLRGRLCRLLLPLAWPVVEQLDRFHAAVVAALARLADHTAPGTDARLRDLETRIAELESRTGTRDGADR